MNKEIVLWLAEKLDVDLEEHFKNRVIPDDKEEFTELAEEQFGLVTMKGIQSFVSDWLEYTDAKDHDVILFAADLLEDFDIATVEGLEDIAQELKLEEELEEQYDGDPVEHIHDLKDEKDRLYLWKLPEDWTEQERDNLFARLQSTYRKKYNRDPQAAHLLLRSVEKVKEIDRSEMKDLMGMAAKDL